MMGKGENMKVGILTYHNAINYGAVLQAYALQQVVKKLGVECEIIDYSCPAVEKQYRRRKISDHAHWKVYVMDFLSGHRLDRKKESFEKFCKQNLSLSTKVDVIVGESLEDYDAIIVGSDQVFNPKNTEGDSTYLLDFQCSAKKIAYAASIGNNEFLELWKTRYNVDYENLLKKFYSLSFREEDASIFVSNLLKDSYETVLDPVLLAGFELWKDFQVDMNEEYIFVYNLGNIPLLVECVQAMHNETGLKVYAVNKDIKGDFLLRGFENVSSLSPADFLKMLSGAKYVITDSFHGTAFSVLYHKNFSSVINPHKNNTNSRIVNLLKKLQLEERIVSNAESFQYQSSIAYSDTDKIIQELEKHSLAWLSGALQMKEG